MRIKLLSALGLACCLSAPGLAQSVEAFVPEGQEGFVESFRASPAIRAGDWVYISGVVAYLRASDPRTEETYEAAIRDAFERTRIVLQAAGADWDDVVEMTTYHVDIRDHQEIFRRVREEFVTEQPYPAWTGIGVDALWSPALFVEIRVVAYLGD